MPDDLDVDLLDGYDHDELALRARVVEVLSRRTPTVVPGVVHHASDDGSGDVAAWWFTPSGLGLLVTFDHESELSLYDRGTYADQRRYYDGVPDELVALVLDRGDEPLLNVPHDGTPRLHVATGVFWSDGGPWRMATGLARVLDERGLTWADTGLDLGLHPYELEQEWTVDDAEALAAEHGVGAGAVRDAFG